MVSDKKEDSWEGGSPTGRVSLRPAARVGAGQMKRELHE